MACGPVIAAGWAAGAHKLAQPMCCGPPSLNYPGAEAWQPMCCGPPSPNFPGAEAWQGALDGANFRCGCPAAAPRCRPAVPVVQVAPEAVEELRDGGGIAAVRSPRGRAERGRGASPPPLTFVSSLGSAPSAARRADPDGLCARPPKRERTSACVQSRMCRALAEPWTQSLGPNAWLGPMLASCHCYCRRCHHWCCLLRADTYASAWCASQQLSEETRAAHVAIGRAA